MRVYEKIKQGIWSYNGIFHLVDAWQEESEGRQVFKFKLVAVEGEEDFTVPVPSQSKPRRIIPTWVKLEVWKRDDGKRTMCGSMEDLHFDHIIPWSNLGPRVVHPRRPRTFNSFAANTIWRNTTELNEWLIG